MSTAPEASRREYGGRRMIGHEDAAGATVAGWPEVAYEAMRAINHVTGGGEVPAPLVYDVLGNLKGVGHMLPQACRQLGDGLARSLETFEVYDERDPAESVAIAREYLSQAGEKAAELAALLEAAQTAIAGQGYHDAQADETH